MSAPEAGLSSPAAGLSSLDWLVIVAATLALIVLVVWLVQGQPIPGRPAPDDNQAG